MGKFQVKMIGVMLLFTLRDCRWLLPRKAEAPAGSITIKGAGSTFVAPLFRKWFEQYHKEHPNVVVDYDIVGSGEGTKRFLEGNVDFGASDAALTDEEIAASVKRGAVLIPVTAGSIVLAYSPEGLPPQLKLSRSVYADIFLGKITHWNDDRIAAINPGFTFPDREHSGRGTARRQRHDVRFHEPPLRNQRGVAEGSGCRQKHGLARPCVACQRK